MKISSFLVAHSGFWKVLLCWSILKVYFYYYYAVFSHNLNNLNLSCIELTFCRASGIYKKKITIDYPAHFPSPFLRALFARPAN